MSAPLCLDLFCGAGGAARGYQLAGFRVAGCDLHAQPHYVGNDFIRTDALDLLRRLIAGEAVTFTSGQAYRLADFALIHASPVCKRYSSITRTAKTQHLHPDQIAPTRELLQRAGLPYVIENVPGAQRLLRDPLMLCGTMFGQLITRHRYFEVWPACISARDAQRDHLYCRHTRKTVKHGRRPDREKHYAAATGHMSDVEFVREAMGTPWMTQAELSQTFPPAYTEWIGTQLRRAIEARAAPHDTAARRVLPAACRKDTKGDSCGNFSGQQHSGTAP